MIIKIVFLCLSIFVSSVLFAQSDTTNPNKNTGTFIRISKQQDYGLSVTRLIIDLGEGSIINEKDISGDTFNVTGLKNNAKSEAKIKGISVTDLFGDTVESGRYITIDLDFSLVTDSGGSESYTVTLNKDLGIFHKGTIFSQKGRTIRK